MNSGRFDPVRGALSSRAAIPLAERGTRFEPAAFGFSLIELLIVISLLAVLSVLAVPAFNSVARGSAMKRTISEVSDAVDLARTEAMAKSTWVWLGLADTSASNALATPQLSLVLVASRDGTTNTAATNLTMLARAMKIDNIRLLDQPSKWAPNSSPAAVPVRNSQFSFTVSVSGTARLFTNTVLAFSPQGEALLDTATIKPWLEIAFRESRGSADIRDKEAAIRVSGISGQGAVSY